MAAALRLKNLAARRRMIVLRRRVAEQKRRILADSRRRAQVLIAKQAKIRRSQLKAKRTHRMKVKQVNIKIAVDQLKIAKLAKKAGVAAPCTNCAGAAPMVNMQQHTLVVKALK